ncbi:hypothetical protein VTK26DRAFT_4409 [Humicola hyalothermophila]
MPPPSHETDSCSTATASLQHLINHVFLPPKTPQQHDEDIVEEHNLIGSLLASVAQFPRDCSAAESDALDRVIRMLQRLLRMKPGMGDSNKRATVKNVIKELKDGECVLFHVRAQNAGLLMTGREDDVLVEAFELLAPNATVMSCQGRLIREFPDSAAIVDRAIFRNAGFLGQFTKMLCQLELVESDLVLKKSTKSGKEHIETRDTTSPILVTNMVMGSLAGLGQEVKPRRVTKRSREQVNWNSTLLPFHRSPTWLLLRVALRLVLDRQGGANAGRSLYKSVTTFYHACLLKQAMLADFDSDILFTMNAKLARRIAKLNPQKYRSPSIQGATGPGDTTLSVSFPSSRLPSLIGAAAKESYVLLELETWIECNLPSWVTRCVRDHKNPAEQHLRSIQNLTNEYFTKASACYDGNPEALSMMYLNIMELWVALDKIAGTAVPLLLDYDPGFTAGFLDPLILPTKEQLTRLLAVEAYISSRKQNATNGYPPVFADFGQPRSFALRYFESSPAHQRLLEEIETEAQRRYDEKLREFCRMRDKYAELDRLLSTTAHDDDWSDDHVRFVCKSWCRACKLRNQMSRMKIDILEWPLPDNSNLSKAIVFEISVPEVVVIWRDVTTFLFLEVFWDRKVNDSPKRLWTAKEHSGLKPFASSSSRVQLASPIKPVEATHYLGKHISNVNMSDLCVWHHWSNYSYYEIDRRMPGESVLEALHIPSNCSFAEHQKKTSFLRPWTRSALHTSNEIIAAQSTCPRSMSLEEFRAFGHLRSGVRLQWANVLCQLVMPSLSLNRESTFFLVLQACLEAGPAHGHGSVFREAHDDLLNDEFVSRMITALAEALERHRENWQNVTAVSLLACLATRVLSLANCSVHVDSLLAFLSRIRGVSMQWATQLLEKKALSVSDKDRKELGQRVLMTALTCLSTFYVKENLLKALVRSPTELRNLVKSAILARDHTSITGSVSNPVLRMLMHRGQRVMHYSSELVKKEVVEKGNVGFDDAIQDFWADYARSSTRWSAFAGHQRHIIRGSMVKGSGEEIPVTFNLLTGSLLVNGYPLSRLPPEYETHDAYVQLFGDQVLDVMPSTLEGMQFSACREQQGWVVHFAMIGPELVIKALRRRDSPSVSEVPDREIYEFIPSGKLKDDFPASFTENHAHWLNCATWTIEFRPRTSPWTPSSDNWALINEDGRRVLTQAGRYLIEPQSKTSRALSEILSPIEASKHLDIIFNPENNTVVLDLPRFSLSFTLAEGEKSIKSKHYAGMCIDRCQNLTALIGLQTKLVLTQEGLSNSSSPTRMVLVPRGQVCPTNRSDHVEVNIVLPPNTRHLKHDAFTIDVMLGRITTNGALSSQLYLCLLHASTSHCLPDPLTGRTGTEEALRILRRFYPAHLENMEQVGWSEKLPVLSQNDSFWPIVESILAHARDCEMLHNDDQQESNLVALGPIKRSAESLAKRAQIRNAAFQVSEFGAEEHTPDKDDQDPWSDCGPDYTRRSPALMAIANVPRSFRSTITPPSETPFNCSYSRDTLPQIVQTVVEAHVRRLESCPEASLPQRSWESAKAAKQRRYQAWKSKTGAMVRDFMADLAAQWERGWTISTPTTARYSSHLRVDDMMPAIREAVRLARTTALFEQYLDKLVKELKNMSCLPFEDSRMLDISTTGSGNKRPSVASGFVSACSLFSQPAPSTQRPRPESFSHLHTRSLQTLGNKGLLADLLDRASQLSNQHPYQVSYIKQLRDSSRSTVAPRYQLNEESVNTQMFEEHLLKCQGEVEELRADIDRSLSAQSLAAQICQASGLYPRVSPVFLLQRLTRTFWETLPADWQLCLVNYGLSLAYLQRAERLVNISRCPDRRNDLLKELLNTGTHGCEEGDPLNYPEGLLLELEHRILIRPVQQAIAAKMREPPGGENCVMQLNMGEGKSSVIVPIVAAALADGKRLVRVVVAKPQSKQMMHTLTCTLGGLINRRILTLPISRAVRLTAEEVMVVERMLDTCREEGGVLLVQPEHLLSFKLMGLENIWVGGTRPETLSTYRRFEDTSRDIVDESDENFSVKFELIYTMGSQRPVDMSPDRWTIIQELMDVVLDVARAIANTADAGMRAGLLFEKDKASGRFPTIRVLEDSTSKHLVSTVAKQVCRTGLRGFGIQHQSKQMRKAVLRYILALDLESEQVAAVENADSGFFKDAMTRNTLLLLRGLLAGGVLAFALGQKRFRVNYGLAPERQPPTMLAVPYRAKDSPAPRSEFSHPDVVIVLTCLSYYYQGLSDAALEACLERLKESDQAEQEYARWAAASPQLPPSLRHFSSVNLKDRMLCTGSIFPALRHAKPAVDFYLANMVFPKEMREFPYKLSASGWDLGKTKRHPLTGFSGTTDSKYVLPLSVKALDLPEQQHTSSAVLECILRGENNVLELGSEQSQLSDLSVDVLLAAVTGSTQPMRVILDVGAQVIELSNVQVAQRWLSLVSRQEADAVIFFNDEDELSVLMRNGTVDPFLTSPFAVQTDRCLVFLDQAHTRGTDLRLPDSYRAAVTLGPGVTKDTLVQACMRMRKLGSGQSVTFCVSPEMQKRIRSLENIDKSTPLTVTDVLMWSILETWDDTHRSLPLWATQGLRHQRQEAIWDRADKTGVFSADDVQEYLDDEAQSLEQRYRPLSTSSGRRYLQSISAQLNAAMRLETRKDQVRQIRDKCTEFGLAELDAMGNLQEEQERELAPEIEQQRQVERPPPRTPARHKLHAHVRYFACFGPILSNSPAFMPAFKTLAGSSASKHFAAAKFPSDLLVTADFARTVLKDGGDGASPGCSDAYQRPVQWILVASPQAQAAVDASMPARHSNPRMVVVSPYEANELKALLLLEDQPAVTLCAYLPRTSLSFRSLEDLSLYTVPARAQSPLAAPPRELIMQLNLFAGQLYLRSYDEYVRLCRYLGLSFRENDGDEDVAADGFVGRRGGRGYDRCEFETSPVAFLAVLCKRIRRDCLDIERTHLGRILAGEILRERDFEGDEKGRDGGETEVGMQADDE